MNINERLEKVCKAISEETILQLAKKHFDINNVVKGLNDECFCLWSIENEFSPKYSLVYINNAETLKGYVIELNLEDDDKFDLTFAFCYYLSQEYKRLDTISMFNTYSHRLRSYVEACGFMTIGNDELDHFEGKNPTFLAKSPIIYVRTINKVNFYREFFGNNYNQPKPVDENVVYLLLNIQSDHIKIGRSTKITHREKTLQAQEPNTAAIAFWKAPKIVENNLHKMFSDKRVRGEWFKLTYIDLENIKQAMAQY